MQPTPSPSYPTKCNPELTRSRPTLADEEFFYLAVDVTDDKMQVSTTCYKNGLQVAFERGGAAASYALQAKRSTNPAESRLQLINIGLKAGQSSCSTDLPEWQACCITYENSGAEAPGDGWIHQTKAAVLRNENAKVGAERGMR